MDSKCLEPGLPENVSASASLTLEAQGVDNPSQVVNVHTSMSPTMETAVDNYQASRYQMSAFVEQLYQMDAPPAVGMSWPTVEIPQPDEQISQSQITHRPAPHIVSPTNRILQPDDMPLKTLNIALEPVNSSLHKPRSISASIAEDENCTNFGPTFDTSSNAFVDGIPRPSLLAGTQSIASTDRSHGQPTPKMTLHEEPNTTTQLDSYTYDVPMLDISTLLENCEDSETEELLVEEHLVSQADDNSDDTQGGRSGTRTSRSTTSSPVTAMDDPLYTPLSFTSPPDSPGNHRHGELVGDVAVPPFHERVTGDNHEPSPSRRLDHDELNPAVDVSNSPLPAELGHFPSVDEQASRPRRSIRPPKQGEPSRKPQKIEESLTSCHQCRKKSARDKLKCTFNRPSGQVCGKFFCGRCMLNRYPEMEFDLSFKQWTCPYCLDVCNCSICTQRQGEEYISARGGGFAGAPTKSHAVVIIPDKPTPSGMPTVPPDSPHPMFWATVYGLSGERVGQAFLSDNSQFSTAQIPTAKLKVESNRPGKRRVYIGEPQPSWGIKSGKPIKYLDNAPDDLSNEQLAIILKRKSAEGHGNRIYIGDRTALPEPSKRLSDADVHHSSPLPSRSSSPALSDSDGTLTPLSVLEAKMCPQPGLSEAQVVQAIHDAMAVATV